MPTYSTYEAKTRFSELLRRVRAGQRVTISHRGQAVAELRPIEPPVDVEAAWRQLEERGVVQPARKSSRMDPTGRVEGALARFVDDRE